MGDVAFPHIVLVDLRNWELGQNLRVKTGVAKKKKKKTNKKNQP